MIVLAVTSWFSGVAQGSEATHYQQVSLKGYRDLQKDQTWYGNSLARDIVQEEECLRKSVRE